MADDAFSSQFGYRVMRRRGAVAKTQREVSAAIGMAPSQYSALEAGKQRTMQLRQLAQLAQILQTTADFLLGLTADAGPVPPRICWGERHCLQSLSLLPLMLRLQGGTREIL